jgi:hypothetical protein
MRLKQSKEEAEEEDAEAAAVAGEVAGAESSKVDDDSDGELGELEVKSGGGGELASSSSSSSSVGGQRVWHPPVDTLAYLKESEYGDQAISLCFRVFNASHLPSPSMSTTSSRRTSSIVGTLDSLADLTQHVNSGLSHNTSGSSSSGSTSQMVEGQDKVSLQVEVCGAPCDKKQWPVSKEVGNDGVRHMFDECFCCDIAEPRLALIKFSLLRKGIEVCLFFINIYMYMCVYVCAMFVVTPHSGRRVCILFPSPICLCGP